MCVGWDEREGERDEESKGGREREGGWKCEKKRVGVRKRKRERKERGKRE